MGIVQRFRRFFFFFPQNVGGVCFQRGNGIHIAGVEGKGDHGLDGRQIHIHRPVIFCQRGGGKIGKIIRSAYGIKISLGFIVGDPDGGQASGFRGHHIDADPKFHGQIFNTISHEFHDAVFYKPVGKHMSDDGQCYVLGTHAMTGRAREANANNIGRRDVIGTVQQLFDQFGAAFAHGHGA